MKENPPDFPAYHQFRRQLSELVHRHYFSLNGNVRLLLMLLMEPVCLILNKHGSSAEEIRMELYAASDLISHPKVLKDLVKTFEEEEQ